MASTCMSISTCVDTTAHVPVRATYVNLYKWPESDVAFVRSLSLNDRSSASSAVSGGGRQPPKVVDSISCRQMYLRSYTFSRDDDGDQMDKEAGDKNCLSFRKRSTVVEKRRSKGGGDGRGEGKRRKGGGLRRAKDVSCVAFSSIFRRLLSCTIKVDVVDL